MPSIAIMVTFELCRWWGQRNLAFELYGRGGIYHNQWRGLVAVEAEVRGIPLRRGSINSSYRGRGGDYDVLEHCPQQLKWRESF